MKVFVTGGCGFIGSNFIRHVLSSTDDVRVTNLDALTYAGNPANLRAYADDPRYAFVRGDVGDDALIAEVLPGHDAVVNFAAETHVDRSITRSRPFVQTNVVGANTIFEAAMRTGVERFLHISTDETYGSIVEGSSHEGDALQPNSPYAASKAAADLLAGAYRVTYGYAITLTRTTNNFGPYQYPEKIVPLFITNLIDGDMVPVYGTGTNVRDWIYVEDNAAAQWHVLINGVPGEVYNVGTGNEMTNLELARRLVAAFGAGEDRIRFVSDRPGHDLRHSVHTTKVRALGWAPAVDFDTALARTINWYRGHEEWWRPLKARGDSPAPRAASDPSVCGSVVKR
ncbi:MAG: dTDP-glucose 4,6-dehydratase [Actinomycetota bacterium]|nr:dTDP-glucose 4,6-dehydratase [Actinomycetota bacterium]